MTDEIPKIFDAVFECTLNMITKNFEDFPDHRLKFFLLLRSVTNHCFRALVALSPAHLKLIIDSIVWAFRHTERNVADEGLNLLLEMMKYFQLSEYCNQFHQSFYLMTMSEIFAVMTDGFHKPGFKLHALILQNLFTISESDQLSAPLWDVASKGSGAYPSNAAFVQEHCAQLLCASFPNMPPSEVQTLVLGMFQCKNDLAAFKSTLRDFLVQTKQFSSVDFAEEELSRLAAQRQARLSAIPGMVQSNDMDDDE